MKRPLRIVTASVLTTLLVGIVAINLISSEKKLEQPITELYGVRDPEFARAASVLFGPTMLEGNSVTPLYNGVRIFPAMLAAIRGAKQTITFETYIYWSGRIGTEFGEALAERALNGVKTHLILDAVGAGKLDDDILDKMRKAGVEIEKFHAPRWYNIDRLNNRTHRKLLVVDGRIGFTGGVGIADKWDGDADSKDHWRDTHFRLEGPAVAQMQATFVDHWLAARGTLLHGPGYFPALAASGKMTGHVMRSSVEDNAEGVRLMYLFAITSARHSIRLANSYFVPDGLSVESLVAARRRGVDVQIIVPGSDIDSDLTRSASRSRWGPLLEAGVAIFEYQPTMFHCKVMIVDDLWVSVGSTNFDSRSFRLNDEANLNVLDEDLARAETTAFEADRARSRRITLDGWRQRPRLERWGDWWAGLLRLQL